MIVFDTGDMPGFCNKQKMESYVWLKNKALYGSGEEQLHCAVMCSEILRLRKIEDDKSCAKNRV